MAGNALLAAIADIGSSGPCAAAPNVPCLVKLGPGFFSVGNNAVTLSDVGVTIEGSGEGLTQISGNGTAVFALNNFSSLEVRDLKVQFAGTNAAILSNQGSLTLQHVSVKTFETPVLSQSGGGSRLLDVTAEAGFPGGLPSNQPNVLLVDGGVLEVKNSMLVLMPASGSTEDVILKVVGSTRIDITGSRLRGGDVDLGGAFSTLDLATSQVEGALIIAIGALVHCAFVYDANFNVHPCNTTS